MSNKIKIKNPFAVIAHKEDIKRQRRETKQTQNNQIPCTFGFYRGADPSFRACADRFPSNVELK